MIKKNNNKLRIVVALCVCFMFMFTMSVSAVDPISLNSAVIQKDVSGTQKLLDIELGNFTSMRNANFYVFDANGTFIAPSYVKSSENIYYTLNNFTSARNAAPGGTIDAAFTLLKSNSSYVANITPSIVTLNGSQVVVTDPVPTTAPTVSAVVFNGVAQTIATDDTITIAVDPAATYSTNCSVTLSQEAHVYLTSGTVTKGPALIAAGAVTSIDSSLTSKTSATGQELISKSPVTVRLVAVDASKNDITSLTKSYTVNFVTQ